MEQKKNGNIKIIIDYLDNYLTKTRRQSIDPVESNAILEKAGLIKDSKDRPGKPLRDILRKGQIPHAFQAGGKSSSWTIPHSRKLPLKTATSQIIVTKNKKPSQVRQLTKSLTVDVSQFEKLLMNEKNFKSASSIDNIVPHNPGLYCIRINEIANLPKPFNEIFKDRQHNIIYFGIATKSLNRRFLNQELRAKGHGTFFRSIGALLGFRPQKGSLVTKKNKRNYKFSLTDEQKIIKWINENLNVSWIKCNGDFESFENELIVKYKPLINLAGNPLALKELSDLRNICVQIANSQIH